MAAAHWLLGMPLAVGFVLGAIVAPPDAVAPLAIVRRLGVPRRLVVVLEGEGLANDATALILYRFAVAAVSTGLFSFDKAAGEFAFIVVGEIAYGIAIGWLSLRLRHWARDQQPDQIYDRDSSDARLRRPSSIVQPPRRAGRRRRRYYKSGTTRG